MQAGGVVSDDQVNSEQEQRDETGSVPGGTYASGSSVTGAPGSGLGRPYVLAAVALIVGLGLAFALSVGEPWSASQRGVLAVVAATAAAAGTLPAGLLLISHYRLGGRASEMDAGLIVLLIGTLWLLPARVGPMLTSGISGPVAALSLGVATAVFILARSAGRNEGPGGGQGLTRRAVSFVSLVVAIAVGGTMLGLVVGDAVTTVAQTLVALLLATSAGIMLLAGYRDERWAVTFIGMELLGLQLGELFASRSDDPSSGAWLGASVLTLVGATIGTLGALAVARASAEATRRELLGASVERVRMLQLRATTEEKLHDLRSGLLSVEAFASTLGLHDGPMAGPIDEDPSVDLLTTELSRLRELVSLSRKPALVIDLSTELQQIVASRLPVDDRLECAIADGVGVVGSQCEVLEMVQNLLDNARKHAPESVLEISLDLDGDVARLSVADDGPGFDETVLPLVFERGFSTSRTGTGLGLHIVRKTAEELGGSVTAMNRPGGGAMVQVSLPGRRLGADSSLSGVDDLG